MVTHKYPMSKFKKVEIKKRAEMNPYNAYIIVVKFYNIKCKYFNNFISANKCRDVEDVAVDNGRIISAKRLEMCLTDVDFYFILDTYKIEKYEILECYSAKYGYLPIQFIEFILEKYVNKTKYKNVEGKELNYLLEKNKFNSLYGMSVTNTIRDSVIYNNNTKLWEEKELSNEEIIEKLENEEKKGFLSFAWGVWVTAYARNNLLRNVVKLDKDVIYCDTDSIKLKEGYNKKVIKDYNNFVTNKIKLVSKKLKIKEDMFRPKDIYNKEHIIGIFENDENYEEFITQGAKKYAYLKDGKIHITVSGVPKSGAKELKSLKDFKDNLVFRFKNTNKLILFYTEDMESIELTDYMGIKAKVTDKSGCALFPNTYTLNKSIEYFNLLQDSSKRAVYKENKDG